MSAEPAVIPLSSLRYTDRSRIEDGRGFCPRARLISYHLGPDGYGLQKKGTRLPLMTGIAAHEGLAPILGWCCGYFESPDRVEAQLATGQAVPDAVVRAAVRAAQAQYWKTVEARGYAYLENEPGVQEITTEQNYLIEGLIWAWVLEVLPEVLRRGRIVEVEQEGVYVLDCTCGLGDGILGEAEHVSRGCEGLGLQQRPDFILETWHTKELEYHEFKTTGMDSPSFQDKWEVSIQTFSAILDVERRLGKHVQTFYIHGLIKGKREGEYNPGTKKRDGIIRQQSVFCYGYRKPAMPPMEAEEWRASYEWVDEEGKTRRLSHAYSKAPVWELPDAMLMGTDIVSKAELWVKWIDPAQRRKALILVGPLSRHTAMVEGFLEETIAEEARWAGVVWQLYDRYVALAERIAQLDPANPIDPAQVPWNWVWIHPEYQSLLNQLAPRSYACRRFGKRHACQHETLCFYREGWEDPLGKGIYVARRPHHAPELAQAVARGLALPDAGLGETEEDQD
jgi:hypothetical protein